MLFGSSSYKALESNLKWENEMNFEVTSVWGILTKSVPCPVRNVPFFGNFFSSQKWPTKVFSHSQMVGIYESNACPLRNLDLASLIREWMLSIEIWEKYGVSRFRRKKYVNWIEGSDNCTQDCSMDPLITSILNPSFLLSKSMCFDELCCGRDILAEMTRKSSYLTTILIFY